MRRLLVFIALAAIVTVAGGLIACRRTPAKAFVAHGPLPSPPPGPLKFAGKLPEHPFHREAGNVFSRTVFKTAGPSNSQIEVRDVLVPPHGKSRLAAVPGPAVLDVYAGAGTVTFGEKGERLAAGAIRSVPAGQALQFENPGAHPMMVRLYLFEAR